MVLEMKKIVEKYGVKESKSIICVNEILSEIEKNRSRPMDAEVKVQIAGIIDKEIKIQEEVLGRVEKEQKGEAKRQMRLIGTSKRIALEEIKKELLSNLSA